MRKKSKSDWYEVTNRGGATYYIEIFGVNRAKGTKHCMRLLADNFEELEVFHLPDLSGILREYNIRPQIRDYIIKTSKQLKDENLIHEIRSGTERLRQLYINRNKNL